MRAGMSLSVAAGVAAGLASRYVRGREAADRATMAEMESRVSDLGAVERVSVLPLVEREVAIAGLRGETGVSYLVRADELRILFDLGLGTGRSRTVLETNVDVLGRSVHDVDVVVISHLHPDHVGGFGYQLRSSFGVGRNLALPRGVAAFVPTEMSHPHAHVCQVEQARVIGSGVAVMPPLPRMMFWGGPIAEQALVINVRGRGLVVLTGCGHPAIERTLAAVERIVQMPVYAVVGGLHLPVHAWGTALIPAATVGTPNWPWQPVSESQARSTIEAIRARGPGLVALSTHDSTPWTINSFKQVFGERYRTLRVGEETIIAAPST